MNARDEEKAMARLLRERLAQSRDASGADCPESETLAAYYECSLDAGETAHWEAHFSVCARCQKQLAVLARTEPAAQPVRARARASWLWHWRWMAPVAAAAAAVALWIAVRPVPPRIRPALRQSETAVAAPAPPVAGPDQNVELLERGAAPQTPPAKPAVRSRYFQLERKPAPAGSTGRETRNESLPKAAAPAEILPRPAVPLATQPQIMGRMVPKGQVGEPIQPDEEQAAAPTPAAPAPGLHRTAPTPLAASSKAASAEQQAIVPSDRAFVANPSAQEKTLEVRSRETLVRSPRAAVLWRLGRAGTIERSTNGGKTWQEQLAPTNAGLLAGSAPSDQVCWAVGRAGTILRTTDGTTWEQINSPSTTDLVRVEARSAQVATVVAADGKSYLTDDGGRNWQAR